MVTGRKKTGTVDQLALFAAPTSAPAGEGDFVWATYETVVGQLCNLDRWASPEPAFAKVSERNAIQPRLIEAGLSGRHYIVVRSPACWRTVPADYAWDNTLSPHGVWRVVSAATGTVLEGCLYDRELGVRAPADRANHGVMSKRWLVQYTHVDWEPVPELS